MENFIERKFKYLERIEYRFNENDNLDKSSIYLEKETNENLLVIDLKKDSIKIQFNLNENYFFESIEEIFENFFKGNYFIKLYSNNEDLLYSKLIWKKKEMRKYNFRTKYGFLRCKKINKIENIQGVAW
ncbi:hypothetical protein ACMGDK_08090 [Chryseobacterium sp. DT-3]|uniref:hypothetical protein n=1 Tax=Chryseobacterium sp. DT-3 TaxID=3396164 RepID=UPI003F1ACBA7